MESTSSLEELIVREITAIMAPLKVRNSDGFYFKLAKSIWSLDPALEEHYADDISEAKQKLAWEAIYSNIPMTEMIKNSLQYVSKEISRVLDFIDDEDGLHEKLAVCIVEGHDLEQLLTDFGASRREIRKAADTFANNFVLGGCLARPKPFANIASFSLRDLHTSSTVSPPTPQNPSESPQQPHPCVQLPSQQPPTQASPISPNAPPIATQSPSQVLPLPQISFGWVFSPLVDNLRGSPISQAQILSQIPANQTEELVTLAFKTLKLANTEKFSIATFQQVEDWALLKSTSTLQIVAELTSYYGDHTKFNSKLSSVLFYLLKRGQDISPLVTALLEAFASRGVSSTLYSGRMIINTLLSNCQVALRQRLVSLLWISNPIPLTTQKRFKWRFPPESYWMLEDKFLLFSYGIDDCKGKSTLLNSAFGTTFETSNNSIFFNGTIDYQGDQMFITSRGIVIADAHGLVPEELKVGVLSFADGVLLHVSEQTWKENTDRVRRELAVLRDRGIKFIIVVVRDVKEYYKTKSLAAFDTKGYQPPVLLVCRIPDLDAGGVGPYYSNIVREKTWEALHSSFKPGLLTKTFKGKKQKYMKLLSPKHKQRIEVMEKGITTLFSPIQAAVKKGYIHDTRFLKIHPTFSRLNQLRQSLKKPNTTKGEFQMRLEMDELAAQILQCKPQHVSEVVVAFEQVITAESNVWMVSRFVRKLNELQVANRAAWKEKYVQLKGKLLQDNDKAENDKLLHEKLELESTLKGISVDILWREITQFFILGRKDKRVLQAFLSFIENGEPFEIIDGDNHNFSCEMLKAAVDKSFLAQKKILVIGIIGPQNSGKSTLLNFMFGCNFTASDGRTTKGVYGSLIKSPKREYEFLLLLDTEGLFSVEKSDPEYDRKVVLFTLAVADVVIVNVKDEISDGMRATFEVCAKSLTQLQNNKMPKPVLFFVQNQKANIQNIQEGARQKIIAEMNTGSLKYIISLAEETFIALPSAFSVEDIDINPKEKWRKMITSPNFVDRVTEFTHLIFAHAEKRRTELITNNVHIPFSDFPTWISAAQNIFTTVNKFENLTLFADIHERNQDKIVTEWLQNKVKEVTTTTKKEELLAQTQDDAIGNYFRQVIASSLKELEAVFTENNISLSLQTRNANKLENILSTNRVIWEADAQVKFHNAQLQHAAANGEQTINELISSILRGDTVYTIQQLGELFEEGYSCTCEVLESKMKSHAEDFKIRCMDQLETYKLYCSELPESAKEDLWHFQSTTGYFQHLVQNLNVHSFAYSSPTHGMDIDSKLTADPPTKWNFLHHELVTELLKSAQYFVAHHPKDPLPDSFFEEIFKKDFVLQLGGAFLRAREFLLRPTTLMPHARWAILLVQGLYKELERNPGMIGTLANTRYPFETVMKETIDEGLHSPEVFMRCAQKVDYVISECDSELGAFGLALSKLTKGNLHLLMLNSLINSQLEYHTNNLRKIVDSFKDKKGIFKENFLEQTSQGPGRDKAAAEVVVIHLEDTTRTNCLISAQRAFAKRTQSFEEEIANTNLRNEWESLLPDTSEERKVQYITDPGGAYLDLFLPRHKGVLQEIENEVRQIYMHHGTLLFELAAAIGSVAIVMGTLNAGRIPGFHANELFTAPSRLDSKASPLVAKEKAAVHLLKDLLRNSPVRPVYLAENMELTLNPNFKPPKADPKLGSFVIALGSVQTISNLESFLANLKDGMCRVATAAKQANPGIVDLDPTNQLKNLLFKAVGCRELCPCCHKCCDEDHSRHTVAVGQGENRHKCKRGHQYRGMAGYAYSRGNLASLKICTEVKNDAKVAHHGIFYKWQDLKAKLPTWDFDVDISETPSSIEAKKNKTAVIWQQVGPTICKLYPFCLSQIVNLTFYIHNINFTTMDVSEVPTSYIFVLDGSTSMGPKWLWMGGYWKALKKAVKDFAAVKEKGSPHDHTASCIVFAQRAQIAFRDRPLTRHSFNDLQQAGGKAEFGPAIQLMVQLVREAPDIPDTIVIIFMSNGEDSKCPVDFFELTQIHWKKLHSFWAVQFGDESNVMKWMAEHLKEKGNYKQLKDIEGLRNEYAEIAKETL